MNEIAQLFLANSNWSMVTRLEKSICLKRHDGLTLFLRIEGRRIYASVADIENKISISMSKTPQTIVDEIQRRLISKIESDFQNLQEKKLARARDELDRQAAIRDIAQIAGIELPKDLSRVYNLTKFFTHKEVYVHCQVNSSDSVQMTLRHVHPNSAQKIIQILADQK